MFFGVLLDCLFLEVDFGVFMMSFWVEEDGAKLSVRDFAVCLLVKLE